MQIPITIEEVDVFTLDADILVLKYAQALYGVDLQAVSKLSKIKTTLKDSLPEYGKFLMVPTFGTIVPKEVLFVGTEPLFQFRYQSIREFATRALTYLGEMSPQTETICFTLHGRGFGLDEIEAFESEIAGLIEAISQGKFPKNLKKIIIAEKYRSLAENLKQALRELLPQGAVVVRDSSMEKIPLTNRLKEAGYTSDKKPVIFVAMPFDKKMDDVFYYGIKGAVNNAGYLCERADQTHFTGDVIEQIKIRIEHADLVIADLTQANPNVYLEVGYAWGRGKPTILLVQDVSELKFDVRGQRCLIYKSIMELEELLHKELNDYSETIK